MAGTGDQEQVDTLEALEKRKAARRRDLWRLLLTGNLDAQGGREFVNDVMFGDVGFARPIDVTDSLAATYERVARHNLSVRWLRNDVAPHRELYRQMLVEAQKRHEANERELAAVVEAAARARQQHDEP